MIDLKPPARTFLIDCPAPGCEGDSDCQTCHGEGQITTDACPTCEGARKVDKPSPGWNDPYYTVSIPCPECRNEDDAAEYRYEQLQDDRMRDRWERA